MRKAQEFVDEYRRKGYPDSRIRIIASMRPEPLRSEALKLLEKDSSEESPSKAKEQEKTVVLDQAPKAQKGGDSTETEEEAPAEQQSRPAAVKTEKAEAKAATPAAKETAKVADQQTKETPKPADGKVFEAMRKEVAGLRAERDRLNDQLAKSRDDIAKLRAQLKKLDEVRERAVQAETDAKELERLQGEQKELIGAKSKLEERLAELQSELARKDGMIKSRDEKLEHLQSEVADARSDQAQSESQLGELQSLAERQSERLAELGGLNDQLAEANESLETLRSEAEMLRKRESENNERISALEGNLGSAQSEANSLREQMRANEESLDALQEKLNVRESELETLREHFEREAVDLKKRAEQEMWMIRRKLSLFKRVAVGGGAVAAVLLLGLSFLLVGQMGRAAEAERRVAALTIGSEDVEYEGIEESITPGIAQNDPTTEEEPPARDTTPEIPRMRDAIMRAPYAEPRERVESPQPRQETARYEEYEVKKGDSLWVIARRFYGNGAKYKQIEEANRLRPGQELQPGMTLKIPVETPE